MICEIGKYKRKVKITVLVDGKEVDNEFWKKAPSELQNFVADRIDKLKEEPIIEGTIETYLGLGQGWTVKSTVEYVGNKYEIAKERARQKAIEWQYNQCSKDYSYGGIMVMQDYFEKLGKRYGLTREFKENGII